MKKWITRILLAIAVLVIGTAIYIQLNKERLVALAMDEANQSINGTITYEDADVSLFSTFPDIGITLKNLQVRDALMKESTPLVDLENFTIEVDLLSAIRKDLTVNSFKLNDGQIYLAEYRDGNNNYSLTRPSEDHKSSTSAVDFKIDDFQLKNIDLFYLSEKDNSKYEIKDFNNNGKLKYKNSSIHLENDFDGIVELNIASLLPDYKLAIKGKMNNLINPGLDSISIIRAELSANDLPILMDGHVHIDEATSYKLDFNSPSTEIKKLVSLLPNFYKNQYGDLIGKGTFVLSGDVEGSTSQPNPLFNISLLAQDGSLSYPAKNAKIDRFNFALIAENKNPKTKYSKIIVNDIDMASGQSHLKGDLTSIASGQSHRVTMDLISNIDLEDIQQSLVLKENTILNGTVKGSAKGSGTLDMTTQSIRPADKNLQLDLDLNNLQFKDDELSIKLENGTIQGDEKTIEFNTRGLDYNEGLVIDIKGTIGDPLELILDTSSVMEGGVDIRASEINLNDLSTRSDTSAVRSIMNVPKLNLKYSFTADRIIQSEYALNGVRADGTLQNENTSVEFSIDDLRGSNLTGSGNLKNVIGYSLNGDVLGGELKVVSDQLDLNNYMGISESGTADLTSNELIPANINLDIDYQSGAIKFKNIDIAKSLGTLSIKDQKVILESAGDIFGGNIGMVGTFDNTVKEGYHIDFQLNLQDLQFQETAAKLALFGQLVPVAKLLEGQYSATLKWNSDLDNNYIPDLNSLNAYGQIETKNSGLTSSLPLDSLIRKLNIIDTKSTKLKIEDAKEYFIVEDGKVMLQRMSLRLGDTKISMSGSHSFSHDLDYKLKIDIPKSKLKIDGLLGSLQDKLQFSNILKGSADNVKVQVEALMNGSVKHPKFKIVGINLKQGSVVESLQDQIMASVNEIRDSITTEIQDTVDALVTHGKDIIDSTKTVVTETVDSVKTVITGTIDSTKDWASDQVEEIKDTLQEEGRVLLDDILKGNTDSLDINIDDIFLGKKNELDSLTKKFPVGLFGSKKKEK